jgi:hypothetical protein
MVQIEGTAEAALRKSTLKKNLQARFARDEEHNLTNKM